jgi:Cd2+/Zn2+-exporting ATPase
VTQYHVRNLSCAHCAAEIEAKLRTLDGTRHATLSFGTGVLSLDTPDMESAMAAIRSVEPDVVLEPVRARAAPIPDTRERRRRIADTTVLGVSVMLFVAGLFLEETLHGTAGSWAEYAVFLTAWILAGWNVLAGAFRGITRGRVFDENFLMTLATLGAILIHELPEAAGVMLFYKVGELLQQISVGRSRRTIRALLESRPDHAVVRRGGRDIRVDPTEVAVGETLVVMAGEKVPLDGVVLSGSGSVDTSALTGESVPRSVGPGETVLAGWVSHTGHLLVRATRLFSETSISRVMELVQDAVTRKARTEVFIRRFARYYTPAVVAAALLVAFVPPLLVPGQALQTWVYRALVLLVISCPCALVVSIPLGYFGGVGGAARRGILVKGSSSLDALARVDTVLFDKTGTLTTGTFLVTDVVPRDGTTAEEILRLAAAAETGSTHPIARSVLHAWGERRSIEPALTHVESRGLGVKAGTREGQIVAGNDRLLHQEGIAHERCDIPGTVVHVALNGKHRGHLVVGDTLRAGASGAVKRLRELGVRTVGILTGDRAETARAVAAEVGADTVEAQLLPEQKVEALERYMQSHVGGGTVAFVGDGINDAPVLARADVGIAMGRSGSEAAIETADVVLMTDTPALVADAIGIARFTRSVVRQNVVLALGVKAVFVVLGTLGVATMWEAVFADMGTALLAILNATRVFAYGGRRRAVLTDPG